MRAPIQTILAASLLALATQAAAQITFYEGEGYRGRAFTVNRQTDDFSRTGFNDLASSVVVENGRWEVCEHAQQAGRCVVLRRGSYQSLAALGLENRVSSVRSVRANGNYTNEAPAPESQPNYAYRRRANERVYQAPVTSVRAVVGAPNERCWIERQQATEPTRGDRNVAGAVIGGVLGGILGHQVGGGTGRNIATAGGVVAGAVIGSNVGRDSNPGVQGRDVRRCETTPNSTPAYWDVTYKYRGQEHRVQMATPPGDTVLVNRQGEPRQ